MWTKYYRIFCSLILSCLVFFISIFSAFASEELQHQDYKGSGYIIGTSSLGRVEVFIPISYVDSFGTTSNGSIVNITSSTVSGVLFASNGNEYYFRCSSFNTPEVRPVNSSSYSYSSLDIVPTSSNLNIATEYPSSSSWRSFYPLIIIGLLGVIILCSMRSRS